MILGLSFFPRVGFVRRQRFHILPQSVVVLLAETGSQGTGQRSFQTALPARYSVMKVSAASDQLSGFIDQDPFRGPHQSNQRSLLFNRAAADASSLGDVPAASFGFLCHWFRPKTPGPAGTDTSALCLSGLPVLFPAFFPICDAALLLALDDHDIVIGIVLHLDVLLAFFPFLLALLVLD